MKTAGFSRFVAIDEQSAPTLLRRVPNADLPFDSTGIEQKTHVQSRLIALPGIDVKALAGKTIGDLSTAVRFHLADAGGLVLASCSPENIQQTAEALAHTVGVGGEARGIDVACSGFTAGTELARAMANASGKPVVLATTEITSRMINWEKPVGGFFARDDERACGKAAKIFGDGSAAVLVKPPSHSRDFDILDAFAHDIQDPDRMLALSRVESAQNIDGSIREGSTPCINMPGRGGAKLMKLAPVVMANAVRQSIQRSLRYGTLSDTETLRHLVHHQANGAMAEEIQNLLKSMNLNDVRVWNEIGPQGNVSAASIPLVMARIQDQMLPGEIIGMPSVGAGSPSFREGWLTEGCVLVRKAGQQQQ